MGQVWEPDRPVDATLAAGVIADQLPELAHLPVRELATGWDNAVFLVGDDLVFRFVHREVAVPLAAREVAVLRRLAGRLPLAVPEPRWVGRPTASFDRPFWGGPLIRGVELAEAGLDERDRAPVAAALGAFLRDLHAPALAAEVAVADGGAAEAGDGGPLVVADGVTGAADAAGVAGADGAAGAVGAAGDSVADVADVAPADAGRVALPVDPMRRADPAVSAERARPVLDRLVTAGAHVPAAALNDLLDVALAVGPPDAEPVLTHGDLHLRHLLVADGQAAGVIDWGDTCLGHPSTDLVLAYGAFVGTARRAFFDAYGEVDDATALRARATTVRVVAALLEQTFADGDAPLVVESIAALHRVLAP